MKNCEKLDTCGFIKKYASTKNLAVQGFIELYCKGPKQNLCKRKEYLKTHGNPPPDNIMPSGKPVI